MHILALFILSLWKMSFVFGWKLHRICGTLWSMTVFKNIDSASREYKNVTIFCVIFNFSLWYSIVFYVEAFYHYGKKQLFCSLWGYYKWDCFLDFFLSRFIMDKHKNSWVLFVDFVLMKCLACFSKLKIFQWPLKSYRITLEAGSHLTSFSPNFYSLLFSLVVLLWLKYSPKLKKKKQQWE